MKQLLILTLAVSSLFAEDFYVSQNGSGAGPGEALEGKNMENTLPLAWLKHWNHWHGEQGIDHKVGPGDRVFFVGRFTETVPALESGLSLTPIIFQWAIRSTDPAEQDPQLPITVNNQTGVELR